MSTAEIRSLLRTSVSQNEHNPSRDGNNEDTPEKILLDEAEQVFSKLIDNITGKCVNEISNDTKSISQTEQVSSLQYDTSQEKTTIQVIIFAKSRFQQARYQVILQREYVRV